MKLSDLKKAARFDCFDCSDELAFWPDDLRVCDEGPVCEYCYGDESPIEWRHLPKFEPFDDVEDKVKP